MTITEKILAKAAGRERVVPGELVGAKIDVVMCVDFTTPAALLIPGGWDRSGCVDEREK